jgi:hypothetical protein
MKSFIVTGMLTASLAFAANSAIAATPANPIPNASYARPAAHVASRTPYVGGQLNADIGQFIQGMLAGGPVPYANLVRDVRNLPAAHVTHGVVARDTGGYDPTFDSPNSSAVDVDNSQSQAAIDASDQAMQQEDQDLQALDASVAAAEQQNDAANAATLQTDINAGM